MRFVTTVVLLAAIVAIGCVNRQPALTTSADVIAGIPTTWTGSAADTQAVLNAVKNAHIPSSDFATDKGDDNPAIATNANGDPIRGWIQPHKSYNATLVHGKLLARIGVTDSMPNHGWRFGDWNYWIAAKFNNGNHWTALMVNLKTKTVDTTSMSLRGKQRNHTDASAKWIPMYVASRWAGETGGWTTCDGGDCCCEGKTCAYGIMSDDTVPPNPPDTSHMNALKKSAPGASK